MARAPLRDPLPLLFWCIACAADPDAAPTPEPDPHEMMPEQEAPLTQNAEGGPIGEGAFGEADVMSWAIEDGRRVSDVVRLDGPVSRVGALAFGPGLIEVQAGWGNGQTGPFRPLVELGMAAEGRVLGVDLDTAATRLRFRIGAVAVPKQVHWAAVLPVAAEARAGALAEVVGVMGAQPRSNFGAQAARCGQSDPVPLQVTVYRFPAPPAEVPVATYLNLLQAEAQAGLQYCDLFPSYLVDEQGAWTGRGERRPAYGALGSDQGRMTVVVLGCETTAPARAELDLLLSSLQRRHNLVPTAFEMGPSPACGAADNPLAEMLTDWQATHPLDQDPDPPPAGATLEGVVHEAPGGSALSGVTVSCDCGPASTTVADGAWTMAVPAGAHTLTFAKAGYDSATQQVTVADGATLSVTQDLTATTIPDPGVSVIDHPYLITRFGGNDVDPFTFPETQGGFQDYLDAVGVLHFAAYEYVEPNNPQVAADCGYTILLPERGYWRKAAALGLLADQLRDLVAEPIILRNWWRPPCYNAGVGGAAGGDHPDGDAVDLDFLSARSRADAQAYLCETYWKRDLVAAQDIAPGSNLNPRLNLSVGLGGATIHLGVLSRNGRRFWKYDSYSALSGSGDCW
ncbi:MAG: carboxypeptidase regulatory-like domain-containing protein [Deltaproteobacteria bacterium]|nr:carboxypeptidase regulatory-like domain-containing protein [Deltaproteobacteria bacterium]